ncbi:unnamed protein product, partial [Didymodactylos carnosus]
MMVFVNTYVKIMYKCFFLTLFFEGVKLLTYEQLNSSNSSTDFIQWTDDVWHRTTILFSKTFPFNRQRYTNLNFHIHMNDWSFELKADDREWVELHVFLNPSKTLDNSTYINIENKCDSPIIVPISNSTDIFIPEILQMDDRINQYFNHTLPYRTTSFIHCKIDDQRLNKTDHLINIQLDIYLITSNQFQSIIYLEISNDTREFLIENQARIWMHSNRKQLQFNLNASEIITQTNDSNSGHFLHMI